MKKWKKRTITPLLCASLLLTISGCTEKATAHDVIADKVFLNGNIHTIDANDTIVQALAIKDGKIIKVGSNKEVKEFIEKGKTETIDLENKLVLPGFIDSHSHPMEGALKQTYEVDFSESASIEEYKNTILTYLKEKPDTTFLLGQGWSNTVFPNGKPTKEILDDIVSDIPAAFYDMGHHMLWLNSKALSLVDKTEMEKPEYSKYITKDTNGEPTGLFAEDAKNLVVKLFPTYSAEDGVNAWATFQKQASSAGITGVFDAGTFIPNNSPAAYKQLAEKKKLKMWVNEALHIVPTDDVDSKLNEMKETREKFSTRTTKFNTVKIFADGVIEAETAYLSSPYRDGTHPYNKGSMIWEDQKAMNETYAALNKNGFAVHTHSIGDAATTNTLDAIAYSQKVNNNNDYRNIITHLQLVQPSDIDRMKELNVLGVTQPFWAVKDSYYYDVQLPILGQERADKEYPMKSFLDKGIKVASSSDYPVTIPFDPLVGIEIGVTRTVTDADTYHTDPKYKLPLWKEEAVSVNDMVKSFTISGAYANKMEKKRGSLEVGKYADLVVLSQDIYNIDPRKISTTEVERTVFEGEDSYKK